MAFVLCGENFFEKKIFPAPLSKNFKLIKIRYVVSVLFEGVQGGLFLKKSSLPSSPLMNYFSSRPVLEF